MKRGIAVLIIFMFLFSILLVLADENETDEDDEDETQEIIETGFGQEIDKAYACLSEDMDMFVYGCNRVLRYLSLLKKSVIIYDTKSILSELKLNMDEFKSICIVSGTDYNVDNEQANLHQTLKYFKN